jgi:putative ABC transport system permease protein
MTQWMRLVLTKVVTFLRSNVPVEERRARGLVPDEAQRRALVAAGGVGGTRALHWHAGRLLAWNSVSQDVRWTFRSVGRDPGFFVAGVLIIGLGIGATTAMFSVLNAVLLRPLPFRDPQRLVRVANMVSGDLVAVSSRPKNLRDWRELSESFEGLAAYYPFFDFQSYTLVGHGEPERLVGVGVTQGFLSALGVQPLLGRDFLESETAWNGPPVTLLTYGLWQRRFARDPTIVGRSIRLKGEATTVVGVLPASFDFASVFSPGSRIDLLIPFPVSDETDNWGQMLAVIGRLKPGVTVQMAQAELDLINQRLQEADPGRSGLNAVVSPLRDYIAGRFRPALIVLTGAAALVLLIVCANVSNLLLARAAVRRKEIAVRRALGAGWVRLTRQMLTESLLLSGCGAVVGVFIAYTVTRGVSATTAINIPLLRTAHVDGTALLFATIAAVATGLLFSIVPTLQIADAPERGALSDESRSFTGGKRRSGIRGALVISEVAFACMLLVGAGLLLRSFLSLLEVDLGFRPKQAVAWRVDTPAKYKDHAQWIAFYDDLMRRVQAVPGVVSIGVTDTLPLGPSQRWAIRAKGAVYDSDETPRALVRMVDSGYIEAMQIPLVAGRGFTEDDGVRSEGVIIVNETAARRIWPGQEPVGQVALLLGSDEYRVVGVVRDVRHTSLDEEAFPEIYLDIRQLELPPSINMVVRATLPVEVLVPNIRAALREVDPTLPTSDFRTLDQIVDRAVSPRRFVLYLTGALAASAGLLAWLGIYGVISYSVGQRTHEIGIRMALGASPAHVRQRILANTLALTAAGLVLGIAASLALARLLGSLLFGVTPADPLTFLVVAGTLAVVGALAGILPAYRASRTDPMLALRSS